MSLPEDLVDYILSFLQSDLVTLEKCAQSHPTLSKLSERYIYADVTLRDDLDNPHVPCLLTSGFTKVLARRLDIAQHVRSLTVRVCGVGETSFEQKIATDSHLENVARLLPTFSGLTKLKILGLGINRFMWHELPDRFREAFRHFLHTQGKKKVAIYDAACFPLSLLNNCENVWMTLEECKDTQYDKESTEDVLLLRPGPFEHLSLLWCSNICLESTMAWLQTRGLHSLEYELGADDVSWEFFPRVLGACSDSLRKLCLHTTYLGTSSVAKFQIHAFKAGFPLHLPVRTSYRVSNDSAIYDQNIVRFPFTLAGLCRLERLTIKLDKPDVTFPTPALDPPWSSESPIPAIVELISTAPPRFKQIFIEFRATSFNIPNPEDIWWPFVPLAAKCSSLSITIHVITPFELRKYSPEEFCSTIGCRGLIPYMEKGVVIMTPGIQLERACT